jgi:SulP family sulfate permease
VRFPILKPTSLLRRETLKVDAMVGLVLGVESVPDGLASGLLAGVNPIAGLNSYLFGLAGGALFTSTAFMAIQGTGAMAIIVADVDLGAGDDPARALYTLSMLTGVVMIVAGLLRLGSFLRFVSNSVMTGFITAVGVNIVRRTLTVVMPRTSRSATSTSAYCGTSTISTCLTRHRHRHRLRRMRTGSELA